MSGAKDFLDSLNKRIEMEEETKKEERAKAAEAEKTRANISKWTKQFFELEDEIIDNIAGEGGLYFTKEELEDINNSEEKYVQTVRQYNKTISRGGIRGLLTSKGELQKFREKMEKAKSEYLAKHSEYSKIRSDAQNKRKEKRDKILEDISGCCTNEDIKVIRIKIADLHKKVEQEQHDCEAEYEKLPKNPTRQATKDRASELEELISRQKGILLELSDVRETIKGIAFKLIDSELSEKINQMNVQTDKVNIRK